MKRLIAVVLVVTMLTIAGTPALAAPPCNDTNGDGSPSGQEYAEHHIVPLAQEGALGHDGHKPGAHHGFSACDPSGDQP